MWNFVNNIPRDNLDAWFRWLTGFAIGLPIFGAIVGGICGWGAFLVSQRIGTLQATEVTQAREGAAKANERATEAQATLEKFRAPRTLTVEQQATISRKLLAYAGTRFDATVIRNDPETYHLLDTITPVLEAAGWTQGNWDNNDAVLKRPSKPDVGEWAAQNVIIAVPHNRIPQLWSAAESLASALTAEGIPAQTQDAAGMTVKNNEVLHLLIGRKT